MKSPIVSLCMPTNGIVEWVFPVLESIYSQGCDTEEFEVVITDNGSNTEFKDKIKSYQESHINLRYFETKALPFINEIESYRRASGELIKFVNHRTKLVDGALQYLIKYASNNYEDKPITYFSNGVLEIDKCQHTYSTFDEFVRNLSYWSSWSTGMTIWKTDFIKLPDDVSKFNELFPHTDILFSERHRDKYIIDNSIIFDEIPQGKKAKGNYDVYYAFGVEYPRIIEGLLKTGDITKRTFNYVLNKNIEFIVSIYWHFNIKKEYCSYNIKNIKSIFRKYYSKYDFAKAIARTITSKINRHLFAFKR